MQAALEYNVYSVGLEYVKNRHDHGVFLETRLGKFRISVLDLSKLTPFEHTIQRKFSSTCICTWEKNN